MNDIFKLSILYRYIDITNSNGIGASKCCLQKLDTQWTLHKNCLVKSAGLSSEATPLDRF